MSDTRTAGRLGIPIYHSWQLEDGQVVAIEGPVFCAHPRTAARMGYPRDPGKQLAHVVGALLTRAEHRFNRAAQRLELESGGSEWPPCRL